MSRSLIWTYCFFFFFLIFNIAFWLYSKNIQKEWENVPLAPSLFKADMTFLGDRQMAYRAYAYFLQNLGNVDGKTVSLKKYDYTNLKDWFFLTYELDPESDIVPALAAYYFGAVQDPEKTRLVLEYLKVIGSSPKEERWRWLGHAVYLARHQLKDNELALDLAYALSENKSPDLADWAKQMPAFILADEGDSDLAYKIMLNLLISNVDKMHPNEVNFMVDYICNTLLPEVKPPEIPDFCKTAEQWQTQQ